MGVIYFDTDCELWYTTANELKLKTIKMPYVIDDKEYFYDNGEHTDFKGFFTRMREGASPKTNALNKDLYLEYFTEDFKAGEEILYISFSEKMSGTFGFMDLAVAELSAKYPKAKFTRFDTKSISLGAGLQVWLAAKFYREGHSVTETVEYLKSITDKISTRFMVDKLEYLYRGGRLSKGKAVVADFLGLKPVLKVDNEGSLAVYSKEKGVTKALSFMAKEYAENHVADKNIPVVILDADSPMEADRLEAKIKEINPDATFWRQPVGPVIGAHCGPGTIGLIYWAKNR